MKRDWAEKRLKETNVQNEIRADLTCVFVQFMPHFIAKGARIHFLS